MQDTRHPRINLNPTASDFVTYCLNSDSSNLMIPFESFKRGILEFTDIISKSNYSIQYSELEPNKIIEFYEYRQSSAVPMENIQFIFQNYPRLPFSIAQLKYISKYNKLITPKIPISMSKDMEFRENINNLNNKRTVHHTDNIYIRGEVGPKTENYNYGVQSPNNYSSHIIPRPQPPLTYQAPKTYGVSSPPELQKRTTYNVLEIQSKDIYQHISDSYSCPYPFQDLNQNISQPTISIGKGQNCTAKLGGKEMDSPQFILANPQLLDVPLAFMDTTSTQYPLPPPLTITCHSKKFFTLLRVPKEKRILLSKEDTYILGEGEGFTVIEIVNKKRNLKSLKENLGKENPFYIDPRSRSMEVLEHETAGDHPHLKLHFTVGELAGHSITINEETGYYFGRKADCNVVFQNVSISGKHIYIGYQEMSGWYLCEGTPKGSLNGVFLVLNKTERKEKEQPSEPFWVPRGLNVDLKVSAVEFNIRLVDHRGPFST